MKTFLALLLRCCPTLQAQQLPVIHAHSMTVDIRDGVHFKKRYWAIMPERKPDYYYLEIPEQPNTVTFITDQDSISFDMQYGQTKDFIILLNGKDSCYTRIAATYRHKPAIGADTIPFIIGDNSKIFIKGSVNGSQPLDIQVDMGAGGCMIKKSSVEKVHLNFDQTITLHNSDGSHQVPSASKNSIRIGDLVWDSIPVSVDNNMTHREDLIVGNFLWLGKVVEMDYDKQILVIHDSLPGHLAGYTRRELILDGGVIPYIEVEMTVHGRKRKVWAMFDTGANKCILNSEDVSLLDKIRGITPILNINGHVFAGFNYKVKPHGFLLGNDLLNRFNVVIDNKAGYIYLKPNSLMGAPYKKQGMYYLRILLLVVGLLGIVIMVRRAK